MSDNFPFTPGSGSTGGAKDVGGVLYPQVIATEIDGSDTGVAAKLGPVTETAPTTDTASSGLNGRLQRIAQRLTTLIGSTIAVSGTFWQATQPVSGTFWQTTQPVSGTVTANAGTNLNTSTLALETGGNLASIKADTDNLALAQGSTTSGQKGNLVLGAVTTASPTYSTTQSSPLSLDTTGALRVNVTAGGSGGGAVTNAGTFAVQNTAATPAGTNVIGHVIVDSGTVTTVAAVTAITNALPAGTNSIGTVQIGNTPNTTPILTATNPQTTGGLSVFHLASAASTNATNIKASAGQLYGYMISNTSAAYSYVAFHNSASAPTAGASIFFKIGIPAGGAANVEFSNGVAFSSGIGITTVTGAADSNSTAVAANDLVINVFYK